MKTLPDVMVAPNGARRKKSDHPQLPITIDEIVTTAKECFKEGAGALHAHVRDAEQNHVLDAGLYRELISEMNSAAPDMHLQITTEAVGIYTPDQQRQLVKDVMPKAVSVSLSEMLSDGDMEAARSFYTFAAEAEIAVQHILYSSDELQQFFELADNEFFSREDHQLLFVLGRYSQNQQSQISDLIPFIDTLNQGVQTYDWAVCAFGQNETACALKAFELGGKCRVGFENSIWNDDGGIAKNNAERVTEIIRERSN